MNSMCDIREDNDAYIMDEGEDEIEGGDADG